MAETNVVQSGSILSLPSLLTILFVLLKVFGKVTWSWWIVFLPVIIPTGIGLLLLLLVAVVGVIAVILK